MNCILIEPNQCEPDGSARLDARQSRHVVEVLKKGVGDTVLTGVIDGPLGMSRIIEIRDGGVIIEKPSGRIPHRPPIHLILAMPRPKVMKRLWAPLASLGVGRITIIGAKRVESYYFDSHALDDDLIRARLIDGLEQARDTRLPKISIVRSFAWFDHEHQPKQDTSAIRLLAHPGEGLSVREAVRTAGGADPRRAVLAIGPEGGWTTEETNAFMRHGYRAVTLGPRALRTDTAAVALLALVHDTLGTDNRNPDR